MEPIATFVKRADGAPEPSEADDSEAIREFWRSYMTVFDELNKCIPYRKTVERHIHWLDPKPGELCFDAGCGTGNLSQVLADTGARVEGVDFCEVSLKQARRKVPTGKFRYADLREPLPYETARFDKIGSCLVMHLLDRRSQSFALRECARVLKPGGTIAISGFARFFRPLGPFKGYASTFAEWVRAMNPVGGTAYAIKNLKGTAQIFYYIWQIMGREKRGLYDFFSRAALNDMFQHAGLQMTEYEPAFAGQCVLAVARKPHPAQS